MVGAPAGWRSGGVSARRSNLAERRPGKESREHIGARSASAVKSARDDQLVEQLRPLARALIRQARAELAARGRMLDEAA